jgi:hypothetical protein
MEKMIAYCGVDCSECLAYIATQTDNNDLRKEQAKTWSQQLDTEISAEDINCDGCLSNGRHVSYCSMCNIKQCCREQNVENCGRCKNYICEQLENAFKFMTEVFDMGDEPAAKKNLNIINKNVGN